MRNGWTSRRSWRAVKKSSIKQRPSTAKRTKSSFSNMAKVDSDVRQNCARSSKDFLAASKGPSLMTGHTDTNGLSLIFMEQTPNRLLFNGKDMLHACFQLPPNH